MISGYDGFPNFFNSLMNCIKKKLMEKHKNLTAENRINKTFLNCSVKVETKLEQDDSGFDTCDSSDERKHRQLISSTSINSKMNTVSKKIVNRT